MGLRWFAGSGTGQNTPANNVVENRAAGTKRAKPFRFELGWSGMFGLVVVLFCLFLWLFLLGLWAGQTILLPPPDGTRTTSVKAVPGQADGEIRPEADVSQASNGGQGE